MVSWKSECYKLIFFIMTQVSKGEARENSQGSGFISQCIPFINTDTILLKVNQGKYQHNTWCFLYNFYHRIKYGFWQGFISMFLWNVSIFFCLAVRAPYHVTLSGSQVSWLSKVGFNKENYRLLEFFSTLWLGKC